MNIDFTDLETQLATLHKREREGLQSFKEAVERAQKVGLCQPETEPGPKAPPFPLAKAAQVEKKSRIRENSVLAPLRAKLAPAPARAVGRPPKYGDALPQPQGPKPTVVAD